MPTFLTFTPLTEKKNIFSRLISSSLKFQHVHSVKYNLILAPHSSSSKGLNLVLNQQTHANYKIKINSFGPILVKAERKITVKICKITINP